MYSVYILLEPRLSAPCVSPRRQLAESILPSVVKYLPRSKADLYHTIICRKAAYVCWFVCWFRICQVRDVHGPVNDWSKGDFIWVISIFVADDPRTRKRKPREAGSRSTEAVCFARRPAFPVVGILQNAKVRNCEMIKCETLRNSTRLVHIYIT